MFGTDSTTGQGYFDSQIQQNLTDLQSTDTMGQQALDELVNDAVIAIKAKEMGITVTDAEVEQAIQEAFGYYANGTPTPEPTATQYSTATYSPEQLTMVPPTATPTQAPTATGEPTATQAITATPTLDPAATATPTLEPTATSTPYTYEGYQADYNNYLDTVKQDVELSAQDLHNIFYASLLYKKVNAEVNKDAPTTDEYIWARHILVATKDEADQVEADLKAGGDFAALAAQYSIDTTTKDLGGDLGWFPRGQMVTEFEDAAFALQNVGDISDPVQTQYGYHIIQLLGREQRPISSSRLSTVQNDNFTKWLTDAKASINIVQHDNWKTNVPVTPEIPEGL